MASLNHRAKDHFNTGKPTFSTKALLHSRTVVEKEGYVSTGILAHAEGDMMEIEMTEFKNFELGDPVSMTIYSPVGIHRLQSTVIAKAEGSLAVIFPVRSLEGLDEKRESPRIAVMANGNIVRTLSRMVKTSEGEALVEAEDRLDISVRNISDSGIGFVFSGGSADLKRGEALKVSLQLGFNFECGLDIIRVEDQGDGKFYGARFHALNEQQRRALRAYLLRAQVEAYFRLKQDKADKASKKR
ncbi:PilZ domain-containing protein [Paenibacillus taihuensis]|uniref:PilZ domain-containing protein n=1 Tax=Paenibacillus taihuensis TaxID=1156355 RepID=A0A3D9SIW8_9BACL|nr:PilZ domain-containing protein [Paenibacillus taihuensis]REE92813.1 PilZ domain-containing protein [Paenibacillus taihuensis]